MFDSYIKFLASSLEDDNNLMAVRAELEDFVISEKFNKNLYESSRLSLNEKVKAILRPKNFQFFRSNPALQNNFCKVILCLLLL